MTVPGLSVTRLAAAVIGRHYSALLPPATANEVLAGMQLSAEVRRADCIICGLTADHSQMIDVDGTGTHHWLDLCVQHAMEMQRVVGMTYAAGSRELG